MSENAERPARSRPRIGSDGAADLIEREIPAANRGKWSGRPHRAIPASAAGRAPQAGERTLPSNASRNIGTGRTNRKVNVKLNPARLKK